MSNHEPPPPSDEEGTRPDDAPTPPAGETGFSFFNSIPSDPPAGANPSPGPSTPYPGPGAVTTTVAPRRGGILAARATGWIVAGVLAATVVGLSVALATTSTTPVAPLARTQAPARAAGPSGGFGRGGSSPFGAAGRGALGEVTSVGSGTFTISTSSGTTETVKETSSTAYSSGFSSTSSYSSASSVKKGDRVLVTGTTSGSTITASRVVILPAGGFGGFGGGAPSS